MSFKNYMKCCICIHDDKCLTVEALKQLSVPDRKGSMASTLKDSYEKVCAISQVAFT